ncbi:MAG TPA: hypothetical protein VJ948_02290 [Acidimicrobiia bacterium]|nr:hypothetical protein [Acidimicrobiia bacterium]
MVRFGRVMALGGLAAAGLAWFGRRRVREQTPGVEQRRVDEGLGSPDPVDEAIDESFPASDPPSYAGSTSSARRGNSDSETRRR